MSLALRLTGGVALVLTAYDAAVVGFCMSRRGMSKSKYNIRICT